MIRKLIGLLLLLALLSVSYVVFAYQHYVKQSIAFQSPVTYEIKKGTGAFQVVNQLHKKGFIKSVFLTKLYLWQHQELQSIQSGRYELKGELSLAELFEKFAKGDVIQYQVALIEGLTFKEMRKVIQSHPELSIVTAEWTADQLLQAIEATESHPEGLFFSDTYSFPAGYTDLQLYQRAYQRLKQVLAEEWQTRADDLPYETPYEALIMASIIEKETAVPEERPEIAGVFVRRLQKNMRLQTDPTVIYGIGESYDGDIKRVHLRTDTPYNTYTRKGLTPTPIAMVGRESIHAALHPNKGTALYFVAKGDGSHHFSDTLEEHNRAVRKYILKK